ncbi:dos2-interacting transcription regulator of RNA-Pol-II [Haematococcus lacustris]|uniref:MMS19 nucleotide excision repair protein n=1 Tax=Haematococcus lacustris TaxID=44745 RepID=A0A699ZYK0_HAELA|nr:dos2-interacting transcription regulator of RNA-Pol-II [Haematococcus lacustris]
MAIDSAVAAYLEPSASAAERTQCVQCIVALLTQRSQTALSLVIRAGGPHGALAPGDLQHLATFMTARLSDWSCTEPAAQACTALLQLGRPPRSRATQPSASSQACLAESDCLGLVRSVVDELAGHVQELTQRERQASLQLMLTATQAQAPEVVEVLSCYFPLTFTPPKNDPHSRISSIKSP